jgi:hypothetical protein
MRYRNYHASITVGDLGEAETFVRSVDIADIGPGTKSGGREALRAEFGARRVKLGKGTMVESARKGTLTLHGTQVREALARKAEAIENA